MSPIISALCLAGGLIACSSSGSSQAPPPNEGYLLPYDLDNPAETVELPKELDEISGLGMGLSETRILAINDEDGVIFYLNRSTGKVDQEIAFWKDGDYEGIEMVGNDAYVVKSTGTIYHVKDVGTEAQVVDKHNSFLTDENNVEALGYDPSAHCLLLGCKGKPGDGDELESSKAIYSFDLNTFQLSEKPKYVIRLQEVHEYLDTHPAVQKLEKLWEFFDPDQSELGFSPSGIAVHPITGEFYILSSVGKLLMVYHPDRGIVHIQKLSKKIHAQPEGICFDQQGTLYISNEGKSDDAVLLRFDYQPK